MKTAISLPDELFERIKQTAEDRGESRSAFLAQAAAYYLDAIRATDVTTQIDLYLAENPDPRDAALVAHGVTQLAQGAEEWAEE